jgi:hypothetical protein
VRLSMDLASKNTMPANAVMGSRHRLVGSQRRLLI